MKSPQAQVHFNDNGIPVASQFDDVYFSNDSGIDETQHVFINGNDLLARWQHWSHSQFVIAETGFGTGLNFLVVMQAFAQFRRENPTHPLKRLHFLTTEKFPLPKDDMARALSAFPSLSGMVTALLNQYPLALDGCHRRHFSDYSTTLDLWIGDVHHLLPQWHSPKAGLIDAWFLDGFAPSKNPDMWTDNLFSQMARLSKVGATFGTFTAAGVVKRGLAAVGFEIKKRNGFGRKRDMLTGVFNAEKTPSTTREGPYYRYNQSPLYAGDSVIVVGSGLAAALTTLALAKRGIKVTLCHDKATLASGASGNPQGGFYPQLHSQVSLASRLQAHSFLFARNFYDDVIAQAGSGKISHDFCGVVQLNFNPNVAQRQQKLIENSVWPEGLIHYASSDFICQKAQVQLAQDGLFIPQGGWLSPPELVAALIEQARALGCVSLLPMHTFSHYERKYLEGEKPSVLAHFDNGATLQAKHLILALGAGAVASSSFTSLPLRPVRGQVEAIPSQAPINQLATVLCHKGYMTPAYNHRHALGSTYGKNDLDIEVRSEDTQQNLVTHQKAMEGNNLVEQLTHDGTARAATRLGSPDHQPLSGMLTNYNALKSRYEGLSLGKPLHKECALPDEPVSTLCCLGSRGLTTAPLMAELLVSELTHAPLPLDNDLCRAVHPARFMVRDCIRGIMGDNSNEND